MLKYLLWLNVPFKVNWHKRMLIYDQKTRTMASRDNLSFIPVATSVADNSQEFRADLWSRPLILNCSSQPPYSWHFLVLWLLQSLLSSKEAYCFHYHLTDQGIDFLRKFLVVIVRSVPLVLFRNWLQSSKHPDRLTVHLYGSNRMSCSVQRNMRTCRTLW